MDEKDYLLGSSVVIRSITFLLHAMLALVQRRGQHLAARSACRRRLAAVDADPHDAAGRMLAVAMPLELVLAAEAFGVQVTFGAHELLLVLAPEVWLTAGRELELAG